MPVVSGDALDLLALLRYDTLQFRAFRHKRRALCRHSVLQRRFLLRGLVALLHLCTLEC